MSWKPAGAVTDPTTVRLLDTLRTVRKERRIQVKDAAARTGMDPNYWSQIEHGRRDAQIRTVARMGEGVGLRLDWVPDVSAPAALTSAPAVPSIVRRTKPAPATLARIVAKIRAAREALGMTQERAAARAGVAKATWGHLERGYVSGREVGTERAHAMAQVVGMRLDVVHEWQAPLLELDSGEVAEIRALLRWYRDRAPRISPTLSGALDKLEPVTTMDNAA